ncbi:hypothetical protein ACROYT_G001896 [Oculina patagonica]
MLIFLQGTYLLLVTCEILVRGVSSQDLTGNCSFDHNQFCNWQNEKQNDHFDWLLLQGSTPSSHTGPISDHSGNGSYIYIETSSPRKYNEKARLNSPWMRGAQRMTFFYSMYGSTVESLSVFVRALNGSEARVWSRYRSHVSEDWIEACVTLNYTGIYQVIMEGVAGLIYTADIAIDDISFSKNLTCFSRGRNALPEIFEANCTFDRNYCGWRNVLSTSDDIDWYARRSGTPSLGTGPSQDHTGSGFFIYIETSNPAKVNQSAQLLSPLIRGPKCFRFYYHMYGRHIGRLDVYLQIRGYNYNHLMWRKSGEQGDQWKEATVEIGYTGESQVVLQAAVGRGYAGDIAVDDVTFTDWPCENGSKSQGNCNFDHDFTLSVNTGPYYDHTSGNGMYIYIETSSPRNPGDTARLESPWMRGPQCMTFYYHMFGATMSCVIIYIKIQATNRFKPVWLKSEDRGDRWIRGQISINETGSYQIIIDGIRGSSYLGDAAFDDFSFQEGTCQQTEVTTLYVSSYKGRHFRLSSQPFDHSFYFEEFRFTVEHPQGNPNETPYFIYSGVYRSPSVITSVMDLSYSRNFPLDVVVLSSASSNSRRINLVDRSPNGHMISLGDHRDDKCCASKIVFSFYAVNATKPGNYSTSGCEPSWFRAKESCHMFYFRGTRRWGDARTLCHKQGAELAVVNDANTLQDIANQRREMKLDDRDLYLGLSGQLLWTWLDEEVVSNTKNLWGPKQPSGDGKCGSFLNAIRWDSNWLRYGWRWNDQSCTDLHGYICQQPLAVPLPVALFSLSGNNGTVDMSPNGATKAVSNNITFAPGPFGNPNGSFFFSGDEGSYVELKNTGELDTRFSISVFAWVHLHNSSGPIYKHEPEHYGFSLRVIHSTLGVRVRYMERKTFKSYLLYKKNVLKADAWNFIGTTYDYHTGFATIFVNNKTVLQKVIKAKMELATDSNVRIGAVKKKNMYLRGRISCLQVYDQALSVNQIIKVKTTCNQAASLRCSPHFFAFHGGCFSVNTKNLVTWQNARAQCNSIGGTLAKISREGLRYAFSNMLEAMRPKPDNLYIGMLTRDDWVWIDGSPLNSSLWMPGYPTGYHGVQDCAILSAGSSGIKNVDCATYLYPLCQKKLVKSLSHRSLTQSSSVLVPHHPMLAIDKSYTTCFRSEKESNPWWQITLEKPLYVESVEIEDEIDCCARDTGILNVTVSTSQTGLDPTCTGSLEYGKPLSYKIQCSPPARGSYVTITLIGKNVTLVLCHVVVRTIEFPEEVHGVLREGWYNVNYDSKKAPTMRENPAFKLAVQGQIILQDFDAPNNVGEKYVQRLTSYLQVPESGNYTFYVSCDDFCELWKQDIAEDGIEKEDKKAEGSVAKQPIISTKRVTAHNEWDRHQEQKSQPVFLDKCRLYRMEAFMREVTGEDHISVGMRTPSGKYERPIPGTRLFWTKPGTRRLEITLDHYKTSLSATVGSTLRVSGSYRFCCEGVYCPDCPLKLNISTLGQNISVNSALNLSCVNTPFTTTFNTDRQPRNCTITATYSFVNYSEQIVDERVLGHLHLQAVVVKECRFQSEYCDWTSLGDKEKGWKLSKAKTFDKYRTHFAYIDGSFKAKLESPQLPWKPFHQSVGLCLRFNYLMPAQSKSSLKVFLRQPKREEPVLVWQLFGNHGVEWSAAQVAWSGVKGIQVIFEGEGFVINEINVAIDDVIITTENCSLSPYFAEPGFKCSDNKFTCNNGECVKKNLLCDGDFACKDGSDEENCECPSSMFSCKGGKCLLATAVCDGTNDCSNEDDENNCIKLATVRFSKWLNSFNVQLSCCPFKAKKEERKKETRKDIEAAHIGNASFSCGLFGLGVFRGRKTGDDDSAHVHGEKDRKSGISTLPIDGREKHQ